MKVGIDNASALKAWAKTRFSGLAVSLTIGLGSLGLGAPAALAHTATHHHHLIHLASSHSDLAGHARHHDYTHNYAGVSRHHYYAGNSHHRYYAYARRHDFIRYAHSYAHYHERYASAQYSYSWIQCVPYAREVSHIELSGDAFLWWAEASGRYARGSVPVEGAVLNFRSIGRMPLGHVAVVTSVVDSRTILVTQANWVHGSITNDVTMQDVSPNNDWTEVEVELGDSSRWGAAYPTYGFIYNQPANSTVIAAAAPSDEVAEAPRPAPISTDAPDRNLQ
jgi:surface antigen